MRINWKLNKRMFLDWRGYLLGIALVALFTLIKYFAQPSIIHPSQIILYVLAIVPIALFFGLGPAIFTSIISALVNNFFFVPPLYSVGLSTQDTQNLVILLVVGGVIGVLASTLRQNSKFNSALTDNAPNPIVVTNPDTSIQYVNPAFEKLTGFTAQELIGKKSPYPWWPQENLPQFEAENITGRTKELNRYERCYQKKNGERFWVEVNIKPVREKSGIDCYLANWVDVTDRQRAEDALINAKNFAETVINSIQDPISIIDIKTFRVIDANPAYMNEVGLTKAEVIGKTCYELAHHRDSPCLSPDCQCPLVDLLKEGKYSIFEHVHSTQDNGIRIVEVSAAPIRNNREEIVQAIHLTRDITERKRAEEAIQRNELRLEKLFEAMAEGAILWDAELRGIKWNAEAERIFRMRRQDTEGQPFKWSDWTVRPQWQLIDSEGKPVPEEARASFLALKGKRAIRDLEAGLKWPDGSITWIIVNAVPLFDPQGNIEGILGTFRDATMRRQILDRVRQSESQFQKLFDSLSEGVSLVSPDGHVVKNNPADSRILGLSSAETTKHLFRNPDLKHIYPDGREMPLEETATYRALKTKSPTTSPEVGIIRKDGSILWISVNVVPLLDEKGEITGAVRVLTDITEQKKLREEREQFTRRLLQVQEEERKRVARELHDDAAQNLALIVLELDHLLSSGENLSAKVLSNLKRLRDDADRTQQEVRRYSHELRPGVLDYLGLEAALEGLVEDINARGPMRANLEIEGHGNRLPDETELALFRIAQESTNNIRKHSGAIQATISLQYEPDKITLTITDNGKGFKIMEKQESDGGGGLGLIGMKERAQLIGASLKINSVIGKGTTISVKVPIRYNN